MEDAPSQPQSVGKWDRGLSGAVGITMVYLTDGTVLFTERPHDVVAGIPANPLLVVSGGLEAPACSACPCHGQVDWHTCSHPP